MVPSESTQPRTVGGRGVARPIRPHATDVLVLGRRAWIGVILSEVAIVALAGWVTVLRGIDLRAIDDRGLISVLPPASFGFLALLSLSFSITLRIRPLLAPVLLLHIAALIVMLYGAPSFFEEMPRFVTAWLHVGFSEAIARTGELFPLRDARFDWPGFFVLGALFSSVANMDSLLGVLPWIPPILTLLYLGPIYLIARSATSDGRVVWLCLWFFCLMNWVGQDYYSPQGFNVLLLLTILAVLLTWFRRPSTPLAWPGALRGWLRRPRASEEPVVAPDVDRSVLPGSVTPISNREQVGLIAVIGLLFGASVASHQLTPFAVLGGVFMLIVLRRVRLSGLPMIMVVLLTSWLLFRASTFLSGHLAGLLEDIGRPDQFAATNIADRLVGSSGHFFVLQARLAFTLGIWVLAAVGVIRAIRARRVDLALVALAIAPFGLILLQGYGGEMLLRIYLFSVPFMAFYAAAAFLPRPRPSSWAASAAVAAVSVVLASGLLLTRYGNEKAELVSVEDFRALEYVIELAQPGELIASVNDAVPNGYSEWEQHRTTSLGELWREGDIDGLVEELDQRRRSGLDAYFVVTRGQRSFAELFWGMSDAEWDERLAGLGRSLERVYENRDATVFRLAADGEPAS